MGPKTTVNLIHKLKTMALREDLEKCGNVLFRWRSYPPFILLCVIVFFMGMAFSLLYFDWNTVMPLSIIICFPIVLMTLLFKKITILRMLVSSLFLIWAGSALLILSIVSNSIITIILFSLISAIALMVIYTYLKEDI